MLGIHSRTVLFQKRKKLTINNVASNSLKDVLVPSFCKAASVSTAPSSSPVACKSSSRAVNTPQRQRRNLPSTWLSFMVKQVGRAPCQKENYLLFAPIFFHAITAFLHYFIVKLRKQNILYKNINGFPKWSQDL